MRSADVLFWLMAIADELEDEPELFGGQAPSFPPLLTGAPGLGVKLVDDEVSEDMLIPASGLAM